MRDTVQVAPSQTLRVRSKYRNFSDYVQGHCNDAEDDVCSTSSVDSNSSTRTNPPPYSSYREYLDSYGKKSFKSVTPPVEGAKKATLKSEIYIPINADTTDCRPFREMSMVVKVKPEVALKPHLPPPPMPPKMPEDLTAAKNSVIDEIKQAVRGKPTNRPQQYVPQQSYQITKNFTTKLANQEADPITRVPVTSQGVNNAVDKNDPNINKLVYDTYRGLLKAYNKPANNFVSTLPRNMVVQDRGVTEQLNNIALQGGLGHLNGRTNPKEEQT